MEQENKDIEAENSILAILDFPKDQDFLYPDDYVEKFSKDSDLPTDLVKFYDIVGQDSSRRHNIHYLNNKEIILANANTFQIINIETRERKLYHGTERNGIGAVTVHHSKEYFAIGECGDFPNIYIYKYNERVIKLHRILRKGTEKSYSALCFKDNLLASVGGDPDYNLVIWNWMAETIILKAKAFSQEIFNIQFSDNFEGKLITSGVGHIRFWEMANTFTGLKLQGELGKFGQTDLSDISAFIEFPDGKVLSGTEHGTFLIWEGIFIKANIKISDTQTCHNGVIEFISWENEPSSVNLGESNELTLVSGARDGYIRWWSFNEMESLVTDDNNNAFLGPKREKLLINPETNRPVKIINISKHNGSTDEGTLGKFWIIQDGHGYILKAYPDQDFRLETIYKFHSGPVIKLNFLSKSSLLISQGEDKKLCLINTFIKNSLNRHIITQEPIRAIGTDNEQGMESDLIVTSCDMATRESSEDPFIIATGYSNGMFGIYHLDTETMISRLIFQSRPHDEGIIKILFSPDKSYILTSTTNELFVFLVENFDKINPFCCIKKDKRIIDIDWHIDSKRFLVGYNNGTVEEIIIPLQFDNSRSYIITDYEYKYFTIKLAEGQLDKDDEKKKRRLKETYKPKEEPKPNSIFSCKYSNLYVDGDFLVTSMKPFNDSLYLCTFDGDSYMHRPINFWKLPLNDYFIKHISNSFVFLSSSSGSIHIRHKSILDKYVEIFPNSMEVEDISTSHDERLLAVSYKDGSVLFFHIDLEGFLQELENLRGLLNEPEEGQSKRRLIEPTYEFTDEVTFFKSNMKQFDFNTIQCEVIKESLENEKKQAQEGEKLRIAEEKRNKLLTKIYKFREEFQKVIDQNLSLPEEVRLQPDEMIIDEHYLNIIRNETQLQLDDVRHKYDWLKANVEITINKLKSFYLDSVRTNKIIVYALRSGEYVSTLRCPELQENFYDECARINYEIEEIRQKIDFESLEKLYNTYINLNSQSGDLENVEDLVNRIRNRSPNQNEPNRFNQTAEGNKTAIKEELDVTKSDLNEISKVLDGKKYVKDNKLKKYLDNREKKKKGKTVSVGVYKGKCPDSYSLKINYDKEYSELNMKTTLNHRKIMYEYLSALFDQRENFNRSVLDLQKKKSEITKVLLEYKSKILELNTLLGKENESVDFLYFNVSETDKDKQEQLLFNQEVEKLITSRITDARYANNEDQSTGNNTTTVTEWNFVVKERTNKKTHDGLEGELRAINEIKYLHKKEKLISECKKIITQFDEEVQHLNKTRIQISFYQKLGEFELLIKHEELSKLRAFESEDMQMIRRLESLCEEYRDNLNNLKNCHEAILQSEQDLTRAEMNKKAKEKEFDLLIQNEREYRDQLLKCFRQRKRIDINKDNLPDEKMDQDDEMDLPRNISTQMKQDILTLRDERERFDIEIEKLIKNIENSKNHRKALINNKQGLDLRREEIRKKIIQAEKQKERYLNQIEFSFPLKMDQFCRMEISVTDNEYNLPIHKIPLEIGKSILFTRSKLKKLETALESIIVDNKNFENELDVFNANYDEMEKEKMLLDKEYRELETNFKNEQILKFGVLIDFDYLIRAAKDTTVDKHEHDYKILKQEVDRQLDEFKTKIDEAKIELRKQTNDNTELLKMIKEELEKNKTYDQQLEEKNNEITKRNNKKFVMYNIQEKKEKLKEILKLLQQQMEALKKEIDIFRRKGGHIYSTIASNLV